MTDDTKLTFSILLLLVGIVVLSLSLTALAALIVKAIFNL